MYKNKINWNLDLDSFLSKEEIKILREELKARKEAQPNKRIVWIEWFLVELALNTGLRVFEIANLEYHDIVLRSELSYVIVRNGKGGKKRHVRINREFQMTVIKYLEWKNVNDINSSALLYSKKSKGKYSTRALQYAFKRAISYVNISPHHSIHHLRHTYASLLSASSKGDVRLVQKQLGHSELSTTQIYIDLFEENVIKAIEHLI